MTKLRPHVLLVDDEPMLLKALRSCLALIADVTLAEGGQVALELLGSDARFDVVLCDLHMPGVDGMDVYQHVLERCPALLPGFVFLTGGALTTRAREFLERERPQLVHKPIDADTLSALVRAAEVRLVAG